MPALGVTQPCEGAAVAWPEELMRDWMERDSGGDHPSCGVCNRFAPKGALRSSAPAFVPHQGSLMPVLMQVCLPSFIGLAIWINKGKKMVQIAFCFFQNLRS